MPISFESSLERCKIYFLLTNNMLGCNPCTKTISGPEGAPDKIAPRQSFGGTGAKIRIHGWGACTPNMGFFWGMPPQQKLFGGGAKITEKIARYLVLKGQNFFNDPLKTKDVLKLKIGRGAASAAKISRKRPFWANLGLCNATILRFWGLCNATIFEIFCSTPHPPESTFLIIIRNADWGWPQGRK